MFLKYTFTIQYSTQSVTCNEVNDCRLLPDSATLEMSTPCSDAMKPKMEKTTKPEKKLVPLLIKARTKASLRREENTDINCSSVLACVWLYFNAVRWLCNTLDEA